MTGTVKWFDPKKGYGFIQPDEGRKDVFVHFSGIIADGFRQLEPDQRVRFEVEQTKKGQQAVEVEVIR
jgi:cold shock CspA family protein